MNRDGEAIRHHRFCPSPSTSPSVPGESLLVVRVASVVVAPEEGTEIKDRCRMVGFQEKRNSELTHTHRNKCRVLNEMLNHLKSFPPSSSSKSELKKNNNKLISINPTKNNNILSRVIF